MIERELLQRLGWSDSLIDEVTRASGQLPVPFEAQQSIELQMMSVGATTAFVDEDSPIQSCSKLVVSR